MLTPQDILNNLQIFSNYKNPISTLLATASLTYFAYIVFENFYVDYYWYIQLTGLITIGFILSAIGIIFYCMKTYLYGFSGGNSRKYHEFAEGLISLYSFLFSFFLFSLFLYFCIISLKILFISLKLEFLNQMYQYFVNEIVFLIIIICIIIFFIVILSIIYKKHFIIKFTILYICISLLVLVFVLFYTPLVQVSSNLYPPLQGHNTIIMENVYHKNDIQIPITIQITGPKTDISINLSKRNSDFELIQVDTLQTLNPDHNPDKITSSIHSILTGNAMDDGVYNIFINTTNLTTGYYELTCSRNTLKSYSANSFYILNNSPSIS